MCVTSNAESFWDNIYSHFLFWYSFSGLYENRRRTEMSRSQKYGDRVITRWTDITNGQHLASLRRHRSQPRMILRWDPVPNSLDGQVLGAHETTASLQQPESDLQSRKSSTKDILIQRRESLFGFRCVDVYTQSD